MVLGLLVIGLIQLSLGVEYPNPVWKNVFCIVLYVVWGIACIHVLGDILVGQRGKQNESDESSRFEETSKGRLT